MSNNSSTRQATNGNAAASQLLLLQDLRVALSCLYSLEAAPNSNSRGLANEAHTFLMNFQSRNMRRKLKSLQQSHRDSAAKQPGAPVVLEQQQVASWDIPERLLLGSTWLSCLGVLFDPTTHPTEKLFSAQTMMHRLRRVNLVEAIDLEMESDSLPQVADMIFSNKFLLLMNTIHQQILVAAVAPPLHRVMLDYFQHNPPSNNSSDEERIKGETAMLMVACIVYQVAMLQQESSSPRADVTTSTAIPPLLSTLGATLAASAIRLRFSPRSIATGQHNNAQSGPPLVTMILQSFQAVVAEDSQQNTEKRAAALCLCLCSCLGALPDTLLASPGGARGKFSIDPRCVQAAHQELRNPATGVSLLWEALLFSHQSSNRLWLLSTWERWAKHLPLPWEFVGTTANLSKQWIQDGSPTEPALAYWITILESGSWSVEQIVSLSLGLDQDSSQQQQTSKKKHSSKSKKRRKQRLDENMTDTIHQQATAEFHHRGETACQTANLVWPEMERLIRLEENRGTSSTTIGCLCAAANTCLPHLIRNDNDYHDNNDTGQFIQSLTKAFQEICLHPNRNVRGLTYEPLFTLHNSLLEKANQNNSSPMRMEALVVDHLFECSMRLAASCGYPSDYFQHLGRDNDEELEIERNDVRDVLRTVSGEAESTTTAPSSYTGPPPRVSVQILDRIVRACADAIDKNQDVVPQEIVVHALSSLAKPTIHLCEAYARNECPPEWMEIVAVLFQSLKIISEKLIHALPVLDVSVTLPVSRLLNLAASSLAPAFAAICKRRETMAKVWLEMNSMLSVVLQAAALSVVHVPELAAASTLDHSQFDIVGAMRSPGGEDHVGVLVFMRLCSETDALTTHVVELKGASLLTDLCHLHNEMKKIENDRGAGVSHGSGITPRARRILLESICAFVAASGGRSNHAQAILDDLFRSAVTSVATQAASSSFTAPSLFQICEVCFDLASFSQNRVHDLFARTDDSVGTEAKSLCLKVLVEACLYGYQRGNAEASSDESLVQWGRLRGSLMRLLQSSANPDIALDAANITTAWIQAECASVVEQCRLGAASPSRIFVDHVISEEVLPAGAPIMAICNIIVLAQTTAKPGGLPTINCIHALKESSGSILHTILLESPRSTNDPRPTIAEAWFICMTSLLTAVAQSETENSGLLSVVHDLLAQTCCAVIVLLLYPSLGRDECDRARDAGMTTDGPQTLALLDFLENYFRLGGPILLSKASAKLANRLDVAMTEAATMPIGQDNSNDNDRVVAKGMAIIGAALLRAASGGLPPWAVEGIPLVYAGLVSGCGNNNNGTITTLLLKESMDVRLLSSSPHFVVGMKPGEVMAGKYFASMKDGAKSEFLSKSLEIFAANNANGWKRFKTLLKQACGGKKKASGFNLKPSPTTWECDRL